MQGWKMRDWKLHDWKMWYLEYKYNYKFHIDARETDTSSGPQYM